MHFMTYLRCTAHLSSTGEGARANPDDVIWLRW